MIHGNVSAEEFAFSWAEVPWYERLALLTIAPVYGLGLYAIGSRHLISRGHSVDSTAADPETRPGGSANLEKVILHDRDKHLFARIEEHILATPHKEQTTAVLFGGRHMPAIAEGLSLKHGYRVKRSDWLVAISL